MVDSLTNEEIMDSILFTCQKCTQKDLIINQLTLTIEELEKSIQSPEQEGDK